MVAHGHGVAVHGVPVADVARHLAHPHHGHRGVEVSQHHHNHSLSLTHSGSLMICSCSLCVISETKRVLHCVKVLLWLLSIMIIVVLVSTLLSQCVAIYPPSRAHLMWQLLICCRPGGVAVGGSLTLVAHSLLVTVGVSEAGPDWAHHWQTHN